MTPVFADTFYYLALFNKADAYHEIASQYAQTSNAKIVTTAWVLTEVADALSGPQARMLFLEMYRVLCDNESVIVIEPELDTFESGIQLYAERPDKDWSLTDCISFVVMQRMDLVSALTGERHFIQAGFDAVFAES